MHIFKEVNPLRKFLKEKRNSLISIGFVPTMGALHKGHLSLLESAKKENDLTVCSIYVNPTQFNNPNDLKSYPKRDKEDLKLLEDMGCDVVFLPSDNTMYPNNSKATSLKFDFGSIEKSMEGAFRAGHFSGVGLVVSKLLHIVQPNKAYFGQKDLQQYLIIKKLVSDLMFDLEVVCCPTMREEDGLAMSSRNLRLTAEERKVAPKVYEVLQKAQEMLLGEKYTVREIQKMAQAEFDKYIEFDMEYFDVVDTTTLDTPIHVEKSQELAICTAVNLNTVRLIDNIIVNRC